MCMAGVQERPSESSAGNPGCLSEHKCEWVGVGASAQEAGRGGILLTLSYTYQLAASFPSIWCDGNCISNAMQTDCGRASRARRHTKNRPRARCDDMAHIPTRDDPCSSVLWSRETSFPRVPARVAYAEESAGSISQNQPAHPSHTLDQKSVAISNSVMDSPSYREYAPKSGRARHLRHAPPVLPMRYTELETYPVVKRVDGYTPSGLGASVAKHLP
ncbi:unnamed protein product [Pleuronectes platessa]|uniref:Uncharacterized protein n=1 Tax=Pleuronectes platessa TaxID=8262 RepID=A0A9N7TUT9_PLEPL|nr:unnamed protein product [Pleuronectes platessa]